MTYTIHLIAVPFVLTNLENVICAFTQKVIKFSKMMKHEGHRVIFYGHKDSEIECDELVPVLFDEDFIKIYGAVPDWKDPKYIALNHDKLIQLYDLRTAAKIAEKMYTPKNIDKNDPDYEQKQKEEKIKAIEFVSSFWGIPNQLYEFSTLIKTIPGVGSYFFDIRNHIAFESYSVMNIDYGVKSNIRPRAYDTIIPNYFTTEDFTYVPENGQKYFGFVGRILECKGVEIIIELAKHFPNEIFKLAGPGSLNECGYKGVPSNLIEVGTVNIKERDEFMGNAKAILLCTLYSEPFGGTTIESMLTGTPIITSDWGVFNETNLHGITGYRARTINEFVCAIKLINKGTISRKTCRDWAFNNYSLEAVYPKVKHWFDNLINLHSGKGFYDIDDTLDNLDYLKFNYSKII